MTHWRIRRRMRTQSSLFVANSQEWEGEGGRGHHQNILQGETLERRSRDRDKVTPFDISAKLICRIVRITQYASTELLTRWNEASAGRPRGIIRRSLINLVFAKPCLNVS